MGGEKHVFFSDQQKSAELQLTDAVQVRKAQRRIYAPFWIFDFFMFVYRSCFFRLDDFFV